MGRIEYRKGVAQIIAESYAFRWRYICPIFNTEVKTDKLLSAGASLVAYTEFPHLFGLFLSRDKVVPKLIGANNTVPNR